MFPSGSREPSLRSLVVASKALSISQWLGALDWAKLGIIPRSHTSVLSSLSISPWLLVLFHPLLFFMLSLPLYNCIILSKEMTSEREKERDDDNDDNDNKNAWVALYNFGPHLSIPLSGWGYPRQSTQTDECNQNTLWSVISIVVVVSPVPSFSLVFLRLSSRSLKAEIESWILTFWPLVHRLTSSQIFPQFWAHDISELKLNWYHMAMLILSLHMLAKMGTNIVCSIQYERPKGDITKEFASLAKQVHGSIQVSQMWGFSVSAFRFRLSFESWSRCQFTIDGS